MESAIAKPSRIRPSIGFDAEGKQFGHLTIPYSRNDSAWGSMWLPIVVIKNGRGPTVLLTGGTHGDEYEGPVTLLKLAQALEPSAMAGRVIILPALNLPAVKAGTRISPVDGVNLNRAFPGQRDGTITQMIAHYVSTELFPLADIVLDIHSGGKTLEFVPCAVMHELEDKALMKRTMGALLAFGAPVGLVLLELDNEGMLDTAVEGMGKIFLSTEIGGGGTVTTGSARIAERGVYNILRHFEVIEQAPPVQAGEPAGQTRVLHTPDSAHYVAARDTGLYEPLVDLGDEVEEGTAIGRIHFFERPDRPPQILTVRRSGMVIGRHFPGLVQMGDTIAVVATDYAPA
jgi:N-alpha-acetyl-L-2,4-diaminobutyrate deacetylase